MRRCSATCARSKLQLRHGKKGMVAATNPAKTMMCGTAPLTTASEMPYQAYLRDPNPMGHDCFGKDAKTNAQVTLCGSCYMPHGPSKYNNTLGFGRKGYHKRTLNLHFRLNVKIFKVVSKTDVQTLVSERLHKHVIRSMEANTWGSRFL